MTGVGSIDYSGVAVAPKYVYPDAFRDLPPADAAETESARAVQELTPVHPLRERQSEDVYLSDRTLDANFTYYQVSANEICLVRCETTQEALAIPDSLDGMVIKEIADQVFVSCSQLRTLICPNHVEVIAPHAFDGLLNLRELTLPSDIDYLERDWLQHLDSLTSLTLPDALESISDMIFNAVGSLERLVLGEHTTTLEPGMFRFAQLSSIEVPKMNDQLTTDGRCLFSKDGTILIAQAIKGESYVIPDTVQVVGRKAFAYCEELTQVSMPQTLERIETYAFASTSLRTFDAPQSLRVIEERAFFDCTKLEQATLNDGLLFIGTGAFSRTSLSSLMLPASLEVIEPYAFNITSVACAGGIDERFKIEIDPHNEHLLLDEDGGLYLREEDGWVLEELLNGNITHYTVRPGTTRIDERAFLRHPSIQHVTISEGITAIGTAAFRSCTKLEQVDLPTTLKTIQNEAFFETSLRSLHLPAALSTLGAVALMTSGVNYNTRPPSLHQVTVDPGNERFYTQDGMLLERMDDKVQIVLCFDPRTTMTIPSFVTIIAPYAFAGVKGVHRLNVHTHFDVIKNRGFAFAEGIDVVHIDLDEPVMGQTSIDAHFPSNERGRRAMLSAFNHGDVDPAFFMTCSDGSMYWTPDVFERGEWALGRLLNPIYLAREEKVRFTGLFYKSLIQMCKAFAQHGYTEGFNGLIELGLLDKENISEVAEAVLAEHDAVVSAHILEVKRQLLSSNLFDFEL